jgi:general secretion pathway protein D
MRKVSVFIVLSVVLQALSAAALGAAADNRDYSPGSGCDLVRIVNEVGARLKKAFQIDPRVRACVVTSVDTATMSYRELQGLLAMYGFVDLMEREGVIQIVPDANARHLPLRLVDDRTRDIGEFEMVMKVIDAGPLKAGEVVPILRPLLPQYAHLVADSSTNSLIAVARYGSIRAMENLLRGLRARPQVAPAVAVPTTRGTSEPAR